MIGRLVKVTRASIGVPKGTLGLVVKKNEGVKAADEPTWFVYTVHLCGKKPDSVLYERRFLEKDLEEFTCES